MDMKEQSVNSRRLENMFADAEDLIASSGNTYFGKIIVDKADLVSLFEELEQTIPKEVETAQAVLAERERIIEAARKLAEDTRERARVEADSLMESVRVEGERKLNENEITLQAQTLAKKKIAEAEAYAQQVRTEADAYAQEVTARANDYERKVHQEVLQYADDMLGYLIKKLSQDLGSALENLNANRESIAAQREPAVYTEGLETTEEADKEM